MRIYLKGLTESAMKRIYRKKYGLETKKKLMRVLESRLEEKLYKVYNYKGKKRRKFTKGQIRQKIRHGEVKLNGKRIKHQGYRVKGMDEIGIKGEGKWVLKEVRW